MKALFLFAFTITCSFTYAQTGVIFHSEPSDTSLTAGDSVGLDFEFTQEYRNGAFTQDTFFIPDGSGASYEYDLIINHYGPTDSVSIANDLDVVLLNMEHSYMGDLKATLTCPTGQTADLFDAFTQGGGGTMLGDSDDSTSMGMGIGWDYLFSSVSGLGTLSQAESNGHYTSAPSTPAYNTMISDTYLASGNYSDFIGCPINGAWKLTITDNLSSDNGYIFGWELIFDTIIANFSPIVTWSPTEGVADPNAGTTRVSPAVSTTYTVTAEDRVTGATETRTVHVNVDTPLALEDEALIDVEVYPNPASNVLHIQTKIPGEQTYTLTDFTGRIVKSGSFVGTNLEVDLSALSTGQYYVLVESDKGTSNKTLISVVR